MSHISYRSKTKLILLGIYAAAIILFSGISLSAQSNENIIIGKKETIYSENLKENRKLWIYTPGNTSYGKESGRKYPVLYLLDGESHFYSAVGIVQQLSQANGNGVLPEMIIVGIENTNRFRDLVPSGNKEKINPFVKFLSSELLPYIEKNYSAAPYKILAGHSLGGLTAVDILTEFPKLFNAIIAIDPSMWYDNRRFLNNAISQFPKLKMKGARLFVATANTMPKGMTLAKLKTDNSEETQHIRSILRLNKYLKTNTNGLKFAEKYYENDNHSSVPLPAVYDGLRFIFDYYSLDAAEKDFADSTAAIAEKLRTHYAKVSVELGYKNSPPEELINYLGHEALSKKHYPKAEALFRLNIDGYPSSSKAFESYADYCSAVKDTANAVVYYKKAVEIKSDSPAKSKLDALTGKKTYTLSPKEMENYTGVYVLTAFNLDMKLELRSGKLWAAVPGQADSEFLPVSKDVFTVKGKESYKITFEMNGEKPLGFTSVQPNGTFKAVFKNK